jgi:DNA-binding transcriptional MerR regulator
MNTIQSQELPETLLTIQKLIELEKAFQELKSRHESYLTMYGEVVLDLHTQRDQCKRLEERLDSLDRLRQGPQLPKFYSTAEVADLTGYSECAIRNFRNLGIIKATGRSGKSYKFSEAAVRDFMNSPNLNAPRIKSQKPRKEGGRGKLRIAA